MRFFPDAAEALVATAYARRLDDAHDPLSCEVVPRTRLAAGDAVLCVAGDVVPAAGVVLDGRAAVHTPSAPTAVVDAGGTSHVPAGARLRWGWLVVRLAEAPH